jgi:hypothetical protein
MFATSLKKYHDRLIDAGFYEYIESKFGPNPWKYRCSYVHDGEHVEFVDTHPSPRQTLSWIVDSKLMQVLNLDKLTMEKYVEHAENLLDETCSNGKYVPIDLHHAFIDFEDQYNYKKITKTYYV